VDLASTLCLLVGTLPGGNPRIPGTPCQIPPPGGSGVYKTPPYPSTAGVAHRQLRTNYNASSKSKNQRIQSRRRTQDEPWRLVAASTNFDTSTMQPHASMEHRGPWGGRRNLGVGRPSWAIFAPPCARATVGCDHACVVRRATMRAQCAACARATVWCDHACVVRPCVRRATMRAPCAACARATVRAQCDHACAVRRVGPCDRACDVRRAGASVRLPPCTVWRGYAAERRWTSLGPCPWRPGGGFFFVGWEPWGVGTPMLHGGVWLHCGRVEIC
jgi:hypothetical protein